MAEQVQRSLGKREVDAGRLVDGECDDTPTLAAKSVLCLRHLSASFAKCNGKATD